jgi:nitrilase
MSPLNVALVQAAPMAFDLATTLDRAEAWMARAAAHDPALVLFPEAFVGGYPKGGDFGARVGSRSAEGREWFRRYHEGAIEVPGPATRRLGALARQHGVHLVLGAIERAGGTLYCVVLHFDPQGTLVGRRRKLVPTGSERLIWGRGGAADLVTFDGPFGPLAGVICWENYMPLLRTWFYERGVRVWCAPTVDERDVWQATMRHIAVEGRCFVLSCAPYMTRGDLPAAFPTGHGDDPETVLVRGGSVIVDPLGNVVAGPLWGASGIVSAAIDLDATIEGKYDLDVVGHYARPDLLRLSSATSGPVAGDTAGDTAGSAPTEGEGQASPSEAPLSPVG